MFRVRHTLSGTFSFNLERGCITLSPTQSFDIETDGNCSRKWIRTDPVLNKLIADGLLLVVHDSEDGVGKAPTHNAVTPTVAKKKVKAAEPKIVDFGRGEDFDLKEHKESLQEEELDPFDDLDEPEDWDDEEEVEVPVDNTELMHEHEPNVELAPDLENMYKSDLIEWAISHEMSVEGLLKKELKEKIRESEAYKKLKGE